MPTNRAVTYTNAPADLDLAFTRELDPHVGVTVDGDVVRVVETGSLWPHQRRRYELGGYWATSEEGWVDLLKEGAARLKGWEEDETFRGWLARRRLLHALDQDKKQLAFAAFQSGRLLSVL